MPTRGGPSPRLATVVNTRALRRVLAVKKNDFKYLVQLGYTL